MASTVTIDLRHVARGLSIPLRQVQAVVEFLDDGNTVPFITRYRKDQTGGLDEEQIRLVQSRLAKMRLLADRKQTILRSIEAQGKLTEKLAKQIAAASASTACRRRNSAGIGNSARRGGAAVREFATRSDSAADAWRSPACSESTSPGTGGPCS